MLPQLERRAMPRPDFRGGAPQGQSSRGQVLGTFSDQLPRLGAEDSGPGLLYQTRSKAKADPDGAANGTSSRSAAADTLVRSPSTVRLPRVGQPVLKPPPLAPTGNHMLDSVLGKLNTPKLMGALDRTVATHRKALKKAVQEFDLNGDGLLSKEEMAIGLRKSGVSLVPSELDTFFRAFDVHQTGIVEVDGVIWIMTLYRSHFKPEQATDRSNNGAGKPMQSQSIPSLPGIGQPVLKPPSPTPTGKHMLDGVHGKFNKTNLWGSLDPITRHRAVSGIDAILRSSDDDKMALYRSLFKLDQAVDGAEDEALVEDFELGLLRQSRADGAFRTPVQVSKLLARHAQNHDLQASIIRPEERRKRLNAIHGNKEGTGRRTLSQSIPRLSWIGQLVLKPSSRTPTGNQMLDSVLAELNTPKLLGAFDRMVKELAVHKNAFRRAVKEFDLDGDGIISKNEMAIGLRKFGVSLVPSELDVVMRALDVDKNGTVELDEFIKIMILYESRFQLEQTSDTEKFVSKEEREKRKGVGHKRMHRRLG